MTINVGTRIGGPHFVISKDKLKLGETVTDLKKKGRLFKTLTRARKARTSNDVIVRPDFTNDKGIVISIIS